MLDPLGAPVTPEFAKGVGIDDDHFAKVTAEPRSKVTFELEPAGDVVKLTLVHDAFEPGSAMLESVSHGWPWTLPTQIAAGDRRAARRLAWLNEKKAVTTAPTARRDSRDLGEGV